MKRVFKFFLGLMAIIFVLANVIAFFHAYRFTHFNSSKKTVTNHIQDLTSSEKLKAILFGVNIPKPKVTTLPKGEYKTIKIPLSKDTIDCWEINVKKPKGTVILFHGYTATKSFLIERAERFQKMGYNTILVDFLGGGDSTGDRCSIGYFEADQVTAVYHYYQKTNHNIILFGSSMGSVAILKSIHDASIKPTATVIECPFGDMLKTVQARFRMMDVPTFPLSHLLVFWGGVQNNFNAFDHNPTKYARQDFVKTLILYGKKDDKVSPEEINGIYNNIPISSKKVITYMDAGHEDIFEVKPSRWERDIQSFLDDTHHK